MAINPITLETPSPAEVPLQRALNEALVHELLFRTRNASVALLGATLLMWMIVRDYTGALVLALFLVLVGLVVVRMIGAMWIERQARGRFHHMRVFYAFTATNALIGTNIGAIVLASYPHITTLGVAMCSVCIVGINSGAILSLAGSPLTFAVYVGSNMCVLIFVAFAHPIPGMEHVFQAMQFIFSLSVFVMMRSVHGSLRSNIALRLQLAASLDELRDTQAKLVEASRQAGRADVATAVLHNVGNALNSVNVSATLIAGIIASSKVNNVSKVVAMIQAHRDDLGRFLRDDRRGQKLPDYFSQLAEAIDRDKRAVTAELTSLTRHVDHIKVIVASQQAHAVPVGVVETFDVPGVVDDALALAVAATDEPPIEVVRRFEAVPQVCLDRHKVLEILRVLVANARDAVRAKPTGEPRITVHARHAASGDLEIAVEDNGCGIDPQDLDRIFTPGFSTKSGGHGLGLHFSACAARELKGRLTARSEGIGSGASFLLTVPVAAATP